MVNIMEVVFILVEPAVPGNIGSAARAMHTMGFSRLRLVNPAPHLGTEARKFAHGSAAVLEAAEVYNNFQSATQGIDFLVATTAKRRSAAMEYHPSGTLPALISGKGSAVLTTGLVFGGEESGLPNGIIRQCDAVSTIKMNTPYPSLNLSQAVMVYAHTLFTAAGTGQSTGRQKPPDESGLMRFKEKLSKLLAMTGIRENPNLSGRITERMMVLGEDDLHLAHSVCNSLLEALGRND